MRKYLLSLFLAALLALSLVGCSSSPNDTQATTQSSNAPNVTYETNQSEDNESTDIPPIVENQVIGTENAEFQRVSLIRVVDGDTIIINDGTENKRVRLIGIDAAESVHPDGSRNTQEGTDASAYLKSLLTEGQTLYLEKDTSDTDKYDRLLRYVWLDTPADPDYKKEVPEKMLNAIIIKSGHATAKDYPPDTKYSDIFHSLE